MTLCFLQLVHTHVGRLRQPISEAVRNSETAGLSRSSGHLRCTPWHHQLRPAGRAVPVVGCHFPLDFNPRGRGAPRGNRSSSRRDSVLVPGSGGLGFADRSSSKRDCVLVLAAEVGQGRTLIRPGAWDGPCRGLCLAPRDAHAATTPSLRMRPLHSHACATLHAHPTLAAHNTHPLCLRLLRRYAPRRPRARVYVARFAACGSTSEPPRMR
jgi:hypothetical protein